jgi:Kef-type K+ transport system membrane component KefB
MAGFMVFPTAGSTEHHGYDGVVDFNRRWLDARRGGGGGGDPIAKPMSVLLLILAVLAVVTKFTRQSNVNASLLAGNIFGFFLLDANPDTKITGEVVKAFTDFGITLVLFFAGLSIQLPERYLPHMFPVTFWYMALVATLFALIGYGASLVEGEERSLAPHILFGVTCTLSSKILAYEYLSVQGEMRSMHGCAIVCVSWFQDLVALVAFAVVNAYQKSLVESGCEGPLGTDATNTTKSTGNMTSGNMSSANSTIAGTYSCSRRAALDLTKFGPVWPPNFNDEVGDNVVLSLAIFFLVLFLHYALSKYFLKRIFRFLCTDSELLFFGVLAYSLGSCALCIQAGFSPFVSAYAAGFAIAQLPSRIQVLQKISAFRAFGIFVFNFMLGIYVKFDPEFFENYFGWAVLLSVIIILVNPIFMSLVGFCFKVKLRTVFITSMLSNNIGEHALILANLGYQAGLFRFEILQTFVSIVASCLFTVLLTERGLIMLIPILLVHLPWEVRPVDDRFSYLHVSKKNPGCSGTTHDDRHGSIPSVPSEICPQAGANSWTFGPAKEGGQNPDGELQLPESHCNPWVQ